MNKYVQFILLIFIFELFIFGISAQTKKKIWKNEIIDKDLESVSIHKQGWELSFPLIRLNTDDKIQIAFDDLRQEQRNFSWQIIRCGRNWQQSLLGAMDYCNGFTEGDIDDYAYSQNTTTSYVHYKLEFPNQYISFISSGNYIVRIFERGKSDKTLLVLRFYVLDKRIQINANVEFLNLGYLYNNQRINLKLTFNDDLQSPLENLSSVIIQNNGFSINTEGIQPTKIEERSISYIHNDKLTFPGGNEFRHFDIKSLKFLSDRLKKFDFIDNKFHVYLKNDELSNAKNYRFEQDLNGKLLIKLESSSQSNIEADYAYVHFNLDAPLNLLDGNYYLYGAISNWEINDKFKLKFNGQTETYKLQLFLKQGYYNYQYLYISNDKLNNEIKGKYALEGNYFETENDYYILTYYHDISMDADFLVGFLLINSNKRD